MGERMGQVGDKVLRNFAADPDPLGSAAVVALRQAHFDSIEASQQSVGGRATGAQRVQLFDAYTKLGVASSLPDGLIDEWITVARAAHESRPMMASDARKLEGVFADLLASTIELRHCSRSS